jgi:hypothetical protein
MWNNKFVKSYPIYKETTLINFSEMQTTRLLAICFLDFLHRLHVFQPLRFEGWLFPCPQVYLLWWVWLMELASIGAPPARASPRNVVVGKHGDDGESPKIDRSKKHHRQII